MFWTFDHICQAASYQELRVSRHLNLGHTDSEGPFLKLRSYATIPPVTIPSPILRLQCCVKKYSKPCPLLCPIPSKAFFLMHPQTFQCTHSPTTPRTLHPTPISTNLTESPHWLPSILLCPGTPRLNIAQWRSSKQPLYLFLARHPRNSAH